MDFVAVDENNHFKNGDIITTFKLDNNEKEYVLYALNDYDTNESSIGISCIVRGPDGYDNIVEIEDANERLRVTDAFKEIMNGGKLI